MKITFRFMDHSLCGRDSREAAFYFPALPTACYAISTVDVSLMSSDEEPTSKSTPPLTGLNVRVESFQKHSDRSE
jgi:hypothetical protein